MRRYITPDGTPCVIKGNVLVTPDGEEIGVVTPYGVFLNHAQKYRNKPLQGQLAGVGHGRSATAKGHAHVRSDWTYGRATPTIRTTPRSTR